MCAGQLPRSKDVTVRYTQMSGQMSQSDQLSGQLSGEMSKDVTVRCQKMSGQLSDVTVMVYSISGDLILGPAVYPSSVKASQLKSDLVANAGAKMVQHLMIGDKVLGWNERITSTYGQELPEIVLLNCIFCIPVDISASFHNPYQDYVSGWSLEVKPLDKDVDVGKWLRAIDSSEQCSMSDLERMEGSQLISRLETYVNGSYASKDLQQAEWERLKSLVRQAGSGQFVEKAKRPCGRLEIWGQSSGFRAVFAGHGISFHAHTFY